jgi:hypothetical protein
LACPRIERRVDPGADTDLEHAIAGRDAHTLECEETAGVEDGPEQDVVHPGELVVHALDEVVLDRNDRQGLTAQVGAELVVLTLE